MISNRTANILGLFPVTQQFVGAATLFTNGTKAMINSAKLVKIQMNIAKDLIKFALISSDRNTNIGKKLAAMSPKRRNLVYQARQDGIRNRYSKEMNASRNAISQNMQSAVRGFFTMTPIVGTAISLARLNATAINSYLQVDFKGL